MKTKNLIIYILSCAFTGCILGYVCMGIFNNSLITMIVSTIISFLLIRYIYLPYFSKN